ncbi:MAG: bifunctional NADP-dependent methylenetetrahydromethanopterin dehydrogenase/methylenetetrahydrofolate dehydrogenase [Gemmataceae bacterium]|nr:bifunctional NADP-dependent methylenetetrahydromethanopterin dehydrogenase/methylenetetrahydrofolate dehydrogenase [Gemmataceae bacterium]
MDKRKILIQLDADEQASLFDRVVAVDAGAEVLFSHAGVQPEQVKDLVHGAIFTRGPKDLKSTAIFIGGSQVAAAEQLLRSALSHMIPAFGLRVSIMLDANGSNTTAAAAVRVATRHLVLQGMKCLVLGGTGPVGRRAALLLGSLGAEVRLASRDFKKAQEACKEIQPPGANARPLPFQVSNSRELLEALHGCALVISAGAPGVRLIDGASLKQSADLKLAIDLNAVPPLGIEGLEVMDKGAQREGIIYYGAIGVGELKMKTHKACIRKMFEQNDLVLDALEIFDISKTV